MECTSEAPLIAGLRAGDPQAFKQVYLRYKNDVLALASVMLGRQDGSLDLLHDVFIALARNTHNLTPDSNLKGYLLTAAANRARDCLAKRGNDPAAMETLADLPSANTDDPTQTAAKNEEADRLKQHVTSLPHEQRTVVALHIYAGLSLKEIATQEHISENTAQSRYRYALEKLRRQLRGDER
jgi:RNA polymerase sigma-70 factor (ECF subfamily)